MNRPTADGPPEKNKLAIEGRSKEESGDPFDLQHRIEKVIDSLLTDFEQSPELFSIKDKLYIVQYGGMWITRKTAWTPKETNEPVDTASGSAVRRYQGAFKTNVARASETHAPRSRTASARSLTIAHDADTDPDDAAD